MAPVFTGASSDIAVSSLTDTLPPFPMRPAFPASEYYDGSAPPAPFGERRTYPHRYHRGTVASAERDAGGSHVHCCSVNG